MKNWRTIFTLIFLIFGLGFYSLSSWANSFEDFFAAIHFNDETRLNELLLRGMDPNTVSQEGFPAITIAMLQNSDKAFLALSHSGQLDPNQEDPRGENPLMVASSLGNIRWVRILLELGATVDREGQWSALHNAATAGSSEVIQLLAQAGANINALSPNQTTPLMMAAREGKNEAAITLLLFGADPALINEAGYNAAGYAMRANQKKLAFIIMEKEKALRN
jgi:ankyrin repeat protein